MAKRNDCETCDVADKGEALFWAGIFVGMLISFMFFYVFGMMLDDSKCQNLLDRRGEKQVSQNH